MVLYQFLNRILKNKIGIYKQNGDELVAFDTIVSIEVAGEVEVPETPIEGGSFTNDSRYKKSVTVTLVGMKSQKLSIINTNFENELERDIETIKAAKNSNDLFTIYNKFDVYENMTIVGYSYAHTADTLNSIVMTLELKEVRIVDAQYFDTKTLKKISNAKPKNIGKAETKPAEEKTKSWLKKMSDKKKNRKK